jgi:hypothetical protein
LTAEKRGVQTRFFTDEAGDKGVDLIEPSSALFLGVRIAPETREGWTSADVPVDEELLPPSAEGHTLTIAVVELRDGTRQPANAPAMVAVHLPPSGSSSTAYFPLQMPATGAFVARVIVLHQTRVLQTLVFRAIVGESTGSLEQENVVAPGFNELESRRSFDAAIVVNDAPDGTPGLIPITPTTIGFYEPVGLRQAVLDLEASIAKLTTIPDDDVTLDDPDVTKVLIELARQGKLIWDSIAGNLRGGFANATRIQVVEARSGAYLPIEFFYSPYAPAENAAMCAEGRAALESGAAHKCAHENDRRWICPAAFWGFNRVIERRAHTDIVGGYEYSISEPSAGRTRLRPLTSVAIAASDKVRDEDINGAEGVVALVRTITPEVYLVKDWTAWTETIRDYSPALLLLFPHTSELEGPQLEIGKDVLKAATLEMDYVRRADQLPGPVVLLLGCNVELTRVAFQNFVQRFRDKGAALVVGTLSPIRGRHATRFVRRFLTTLRDRAASGGVPVGDVLLEVKRTMLFAGDPFALTLVAYGDADWQL